VLDREKQKRRDDAKRRLQAIVRLIQVLNISLYVLLRCYLFPYGGEQAVVGPFED